MLRTPLQARLCFTYRCNLRCSFCYERFARTSGSGKELPLSSWLSLLEELRGLGVFSVALIGGEPLCHPYMKPLLEDLTDGPMRFGLYTNGTLLDDAWVELLQATRRCSHVTISLDGFEDYHDGIRGSGMFRRTLAGIERLVSVGIPVRIAGVVSHDNYRAIPEFARFLESLPICEYKFSMRGDAAYGEDELCGELNLEEKVEFFLSMERIRSELKKIGSSSAPFPLLSQLRHPRPVAEIAPCCRDPLTTFAVLPDGSVPVCASYDDAPVAGWIGKQRVIDIWNGSVMNEFREQQRCGQELPWEKCGDCEHRQSCRKYCPKLEKVWLCRKEIAEALAKVEQMVECS